MVLNINAGVSLRDTLNALKLQLAIVPTSVTVSSILLLVGFCLLA